MILDVGTSRIGHQGGVHRVSLFAELVHEFVFFTTIHHIVFEVIGCGFIFEVFTRTCKDDLLYPIGEEKDVGGDLICLSPIAELALLNVDGVKTGKVAV